MARLVVLAALTAAARVAMAACDPAICVGDPCTIGGTQTLDPGCRLDFGDKTVTVAGTLSIPAGATVAVHAKRLVISGTLRAPGGDVTLDVDEDLTIAASGRIDAAATAAAEYGSVDLSALGAIVVQGRVVTDGNGYGGDINLYGSTITVGGTLQANADELGGYVWLESDGNVTIDGTVTADATGTKPGDGGAVEIWGSQALGVGASGVVRASGKNGGLGGFLFVVVDGDITLDGELGADAGGGGAVGGSVSLDGASLAIAGTCTANGGSGVDSGGGDVGIAATGSVVLMATSTLRANGNGGGGEVDVEGRSAATLGGAIQATASANGSRGGRIVATANPRGTVSVGGILDVRSTGTDGIDGSIVLLACDLTVSGTLRAKQGSHAQGSNTLGYGGTLTLMATAQVQAGSVGGNITQCTCQGVNTATRTCSTPLGCEVAPAVAAGASVTPAWRLTPIVQVPCHCFDDLKDGTETGRDCGGGACPKCPAGQGCATVADCLTGVCDMGVCKDASCADMVQNGEESDEDCGGPLCPPCEALRRCRTNGDCRTLTCIMGTCFGPRCVDTVLNGFETDVDCGGPFCPHCGVGKKCVNGARDCISGSCEGGACQEPRCDDEVANGTESGTDCGGGICPRCPPGQPCHTDGDCDSDLCNGGLCQVPACPDQRHNGAETDFDCGGGPPCPPCGVGQRCEDGQGARDCVYKVCTSLECQDAACDDKIMNGQESDIDCGGPTTCDRCGDGSSCMVWSDCQSLVCAGGTCQKATCTDGVKNDGETGKDCGGQTPCVRCPTGEPCDDGTDCTSEVCGNAGTCVAPSCGDKVKNGGETDQDCGGPTSCNRCRSGKTCQQDGDCESRVCDASVCQDPTCFDRATNGGETDHNCGGTTQCVRCKPGQHCLLDSDCDAVRCDPQQHVCAASSCTDGLHNGGESGTDCGGATTCKRCGTGDPCGAGSDCASGVCGDDGRCRAASCTDGVRNGRETGVDCGDGCPGCKTGDPCTKDADCLSHRCPATAKRCAIPNHCRDDYEACLARCGGFDRETCTCRCFDTFCRCPDESGRRRCVPIRCP